MALTGDAAATDPICVKSPHHARLAQAAEDLADSGAVDLIYRREPEAVPSN
jgi:pyrroloquinoline quinone biosynthesis protein E